MASRAITYDRFKEEYGDYGPRWAGQQRDNGVGLFHAENLVVYENGALGPRAGLKKYNYSSVPTGVVTGVFDAGFPGKTLLFSVGTSLYYVDSEQATDTVTAVGTGSFATTPTRVEGRTGRAGAIYITSLADDTYEYDDVTDTLAAATGAPGGLTATLHGERLYVGGEEGTSAAPAYRVYYSDAADYTTFQALNYFDVYGPGGSEVNNLISLGTRLIIQTEDDLYVYQGVPGLDSLRRIIRTGIGVARTPGVLVSAGDELWFATRRGTLGWSNGSQTDGDRWERLSLGTESVRGLYDPFEDVVMLIADGGGALVRRQGVWTRHTFPASLTNLGCNRYRPGTREEGFVLTDGGGASTAASFYASVNDIQRPGFTSDTFANVGDDSATPFDASLELPEYRSTGKELIVREVKVDFIKWQTGQTATTHFDVKVRAWSQYSSDGYTDSDTLSFDEPNSQAPAGTTGTEQRANFTFGDQGQGAGFQVLLSNIRACAIRAVTVVFEEREPRSR